METCVACSTTAKFLVKDRFGWKPCCNLHKVIWSRPEYAHYNYTFKPNPLYTEGR